MRINKAIVLSIVVLGSLLSNVKNVGAEEMAPPTLNMPLNIDNTNRVSLTDYQLEADLMWDNYVELRRQLILLEKEYPQYIEYVLLENNNPAGLYIFSDDIYNTLEGSAIADHVISTIELAEFYRLGSIDFKNKSSFTTI